MPEIFYSQKWFAIFTRVYAGGFVSSNTNDFVDNNSSYDDGAFFSLWDMALSRLTYKHMDYKKLLSKGVEWSGKPYLGSYVQLLSGWSYVSCIVPQGIPGVYCNTDMIALGFSHLQIWKHWKADTELKTVMINQRHSPREI